ncbi:hypothetical protein OUY22_10015 [Nonomuraea sp. MCN248]|uniref:4-oxalocrotonate tautomerase domain-containing protein n=1 Tax=Nonomuraea corallina TaxID=2989783 RepID=A0ABT4S9L4_9ACTN|nr:hypothetical protein [Nonomuraea corallina]MDA0633753.1 hypothetical protein [Nonomuraea corallina]
MPRFTVDVPQGAPPDATQKMPKEITEALDEAYQIPDTRGWLREHPVENVSQDGRVGTEPVRPVFSLEAPELFRLDAKRKVVQKIESAIAGAYKGIANTDEVLVLINEYPLHNVGMASQPAIGQAGNRGCRNPGQRLVRQALPVARGVHTPKGHGSAGDSGSPAPPRTTCAAPASTMSVTGTAVLPVRDKTVDFPAGLPGLSMWIHACYLAPDGCAPVRASRRAVARRDLLWLRRTAVRTPQAGLQVCPRGGRVGSGYPGPVAGEHRLVLTRHAEADPAAASHRGRGLLVGGVRGHRHPATSLISEPVLCRSCVDQYRNETGPREAGAGPLKTSRRPAPFGYSRM